jgi:hypothetical protein
MNKVWGWTYLPFYALLLAGAAAAHEGHDHGAAPAPEVAAPDATAPRLALHSARVELVAVRDARDLLVYIDDYETNAPLAGLRVQLRAGSRLLSAQPVEAGTYRIVADALDAAVPQPAVFLLHSDAWSEQLEGVLPPAQPVAPAGPADSSELALAVAGFVALALLAAGFRLRRLRRTHTA